MYYKKFGEKKNNHPKSLIPFGAQTMYLYIVCIKNNIHIKYNCA